MAVNRSKELLQASPDAGALVGIAVDKNGVCD
jgi:hypothetical protein